MVGLNLPHRKFLQAFGLERKAVLARKRKREIDSAPELVDRLRR